MRIAVFTGSSSGNVPRFGEFAARFGHDLATAGAGIVYGGGNIGLMGALADSALAAGGEVIGVIPQSLVDREVAHRGLTRLEVVETLHERKARMAALADAFVALPGGAGTLDEWFEAFTWGQLGLHDKPVALADIDGFWQPLLDLLERQRDTGFLPRERLASLPVVASAGELIERLRQQR